MRSRGVEIALVMDFVDRTVAHDVPVRVALTRAAKRYGVDRGLLRLFYRTHGSR